MKRCSAIIALFVTGCVTFPKVPGHKVADGSVLVIRASQTHHYSGALKFWVIPEEPNDKDVPLVRRYDFGAAETPVKHLISRKQDLLLHYPDYSWRSQWTFRLSGPAEWRVQ